MTCVLRTASLLAEAMRQLMLCVKAVPVAQQALCVWQTHLLEGHADVRQAKLLIEKCEIVCKAAACPPRVM